LRALVVTFAELEAHRAPFSVIATEERIALTIGEYCLNCRIDRIDRLESGKTLLIDYKTGSQTIGAWFGARLGDCQMPLYAQHQVETVAAIAIASLRDDGTELRAFGALNRELPGRQRRIDDAAWQQQLGRWREQIELLVAEFGDGDVRVSLTPPARAELGFACLTRVQEQLL
jgi:hypothetical protein